MKRLTFAVVWAVCAVPAFAQSGAPPTEEPLTELARQERERRAKVAGDAKVITERDLPRGTAPSAASIEPGEAAAAPAADAAATPSAEDEREAQRADIQRRIDDELAVIAAVERAMADSERELNNLTDYRFGSRRDLLVKAMEDGRAQIARSEQVIAELEEEARRAAVRVSRTPPSER